MGNLIKLVPSLGDDTPPLNSLLPILSELTLSKTETRITPTTVSTLHQTTPGIPDDLTLPPVLIPKTPCYYFISINLSYNPDCTPSPRTSLQKPMNKTYS